MSEFMTAGLLSVGLSNTYCIPYTLFDQLLGGDLWVFVTGWADIVY